MEYIRDLLPKDKFDTASLERLMSLSDEQINEIIPDLLEWIQDMNWPVAPCIITVLAKHRKATERHLIALLKPEQEDAEWKLHIIASLLNEWPSYSDDKIVAEIVRIASYPTEAERLEEVDVAAADYLNKSL